MLFQTLFSYRRSFPDCSTITPVPSTVSSAVLQLKPARAHAAHAACTLEPKFVDLQSSLPFLTLSKQATCMQNLDFHVAAWFTTWLDHQAHTYCTCRLLPDFNGQTRLVLGASICTMYFIPVVCACTCRMRECGWTSQGARW